MSMKTAGMKTIAKTAVLTIWGLWTAVSSFITPFWLSMALIGMTGQMEKYDWSLHDGDGAVWVFIGFFMLAFWGLLAAFPGIFFLRSLKSYEKRIFAAGCLCVSAILIAGTGMLIYEGL